MFKMHGQELLFTALRQIILSGIASKLYLRLPQFCYTLPDEVLRRLLKSPLDCPSVPVYKTVLSFVSMGRHSVFLVYFSLCHCNLYRFIEIAVTQGEINLENTNPTH